MSTDEGPYFVTVNTDPPKPPYGTPERGAYDAALSQPIRVDRRTPEEVQADLAADRYEASLERAWDS